MSAVNAFLLKYTVTDEDDSNPWLLLNLIGDTSECRSGNNGNRPSNVKMGTGVKQKILLIWNISEYMHGMHA